MYVSCLPTKYPHKSINPTPSSSHICSTRALIVILLQRYKRGSICCLFQCTFFQLVPLSINRSKFSENTAATFPLRWRPSLVYMSSFPTKYPHTSMNPTPSSSHICSTRALITSLLQFLLCCSPNSHYSTGNIPERIICSTLVFFSFPTNCLYLCTILVVPSLSALFVPTGTNVDPPWPCPSVFSTRSVTGSTLAPGRQTTSFPLLSTLVGGWYGIEILHG